MNIRIFFTILPDIRGLHHELHESKKNRKLRIFGSCVESTKGTDGQIIVSREEVFFFVEWIVSLILLN